ncbi:MAG: hypothetical protein LAP13_14735 [Acidobacteriia bacterium]|nr:hypothetical protein [Terriglobia bacterium]
MRRSRVDRRKFLRLALAGAAAGYSLAKEELANAEVTAPAAVLRVEADAQRALVPVLSWDTEGGGRARTNLLRAQSPLNLRLRVGGAWRSSQDFPVRKEAFAREGSRFHLTVAPGREFLWEIMPEANRLTMTVSRQGSGDAAAESLEMVFPFDPQVTPTTALPSAWSEDGKLVLPAVLSAPDFGQMLLSETTHHGLRGRLEGNRQRHTVDLVLELPALRSGETCALELNPLSLPPPTGLKDTALWAQARRGWFNIWQLSASAGVLANNVISDPVSFSLWFHADLALWVPVVAPGISAMAQVKRSLEWWLDKRTRPSGEVIGYWDLGNFLDANPSLLIAAWDYVEATGDRDWLARRIERLEFVADFLARRDVDGDGLVEATQTGNRGTLRQPGRSCNWFDALNCGHKDGYTNALTYRAWRCLAELESLVARRKQQALYSRLADRLKAAYAETLYNPETGWLAWWKSADGELHDYATPFINGMAIEYGLLDPKQGRKVLERLWEKMETVGFTRFDLGLPCTLIPVHRSDYLLPSSLGCPSREDGTDTFGQYMNGGISAGHTLHFLAAHYILGQGNKADAILRAMLRRQGEMGFQNGVRDAFGQGLDWTTWQGKACGYEGYLADTYYFLQAVLLRERAFRSRYYRPLAGGSGRG